MLECDPGFEMPSRPVIAGGAVPEMLHATVDQRTVPTGAILLRERNNHSIASNRVGNRAALKQKSAASACTERRSTALRLEQKLGETDGVRAHRGVKRALRITAVVALVEKQVERLLDRRLSSADVLHRAHIVKGPKLLEARPAAMQASIDRLRRRPEMPARSRPKRDPRAGEVSA